MKHKQPGELRIVFDTEKTDVTPQAGEFNQAMQAYVDAFGHVPFGIGMPEATTEILTDSVMTGKPIKPHRLPKEALINSFPINSAP